MLTISRLPPIYVAADDLWHCEEDGCVYVPDLDERVWRMQGGVRVRHFPPKAKLLQSLDNDDASIRD